MANYSVNRVTLLGNIGSDAKLNTSGNNLPFLRFDVATHEEWTDKQTGESKQSTDWHPVVIWGRRAEKLADLFKKGRQVYIEGKQRTRVWEGTDGQKHRITEVLVGSDGQAILTDTRPSGEARQGATASSEPPFDPSAYNDLPGQ